MTPAQARERIRERSDLNAFISLTEEDGEGPVVAVKDLVDVRGAVTTAGSVLLPSVPAEDDAPTVRRMREFGCVVVGKTNLHEWAFGVTSDNPHYGPVRNPRNPELVAGGSSGGSAAAVDHQGAARSLPREPAFPPGRDRRRSRRTRSALRQSVRPRP